MFDVNIGDEFASQMGCVSFVQASIGPEGWLRVTPQMILDGGTYDYNSYSVMLIDEDGNPIPFATLDCSHLGEMITVKVINSCTGNSCWGKIVAEDKLAPVIECFDDTLNCANMSEYLGPVAQDNCDPTPEVILLNETAEKLECDSNFIKRITRTYIARDASGNVSDTCVQHILLERFNFDNVEGPEDFSLANGNPLLCDQFPLDENLNPDPSVTGYPQHNNWDLWPNNDLYCNITVAYYDINLPSAGCVRKILRTWYIFEWYCTADLLQRLYIQRIDIADTTAPSITCPEDVTVTTTGKDCEAQVWVNFPDVEDDCSDSVKVDLTWPSGFAADFKGGFIPLTVGEHTLKFYVYDECYNSDSCEFVVTVEDRNPPVSVCDQHTTVGLDIDGGAYVYAETFDDGSFDDCHIAVMEVKRMDDGADCGIDASAFGPYVEFCCDDIGEPVMVIFRVTDHDGNSNTCMVEVTVQDKIPPEIYCPAPDTIDCHYHFDINDLSEFGQPVHKRQLRLYFERHGYRSDRSMP